jgi:hypothetical protein
MVQPDFEVVILSFQIMPKNVKSSDDSKEFFIVDLVVLFGWLQGVWMISNGVPSVKGIWLLQNSTGGKVTSVSDEVKGSGIVRQGQNWSSGKGMNEGSKCRFLVSFPMEGDSFLG